MGEQNVKLNKDDATYQEFMKSLLTEVHALETMLERGLIETGVRPHWRGAGNVPDRQGA